MDERPYYSVAEVAQMLGLKEVTVREWLKTGKLQGKRVGKYWRVSKKSVCKVLPEDKNNPE
jgi:excisionase family DNA binding protein